MNRLIVLLAQTMGFVLFGAAMAGCGSSGSNSSTNNAGTCSASGYVYSASYGCIPQSNCGSGYGLYNGQCVLLSSTTASSSCSSGYYWNGYQCVVNSTSSTYGTSSTTNACQSSCSSGYVYTARGCLPRTSQCPSCAGTDGYMCYWSVYTLQTGYY